MADLADGIDAAVEAVLMRAASATGTPVYVYRPEGVVSRIEALRRLFGGGVSVSFAVKANPNLGLLRALSPHLDRLDVSSVGELRRGLEAGFDPASITFTGPAKRDAEIEHAVDAGATLVCESVHDLERLDRAASRRGRTVPAILRVNPATVPAGFGIPMAGGPSQFGIDEEELDAVLGDIGRWRAVRFEGFHVYLGSNALDAGVVAAATTGALGLFAAVAARHGLKARTVVIGPGFGVPYFPGEAPLDIDEVARLTVPAIDELRVPGSPLQGAEPVLELGRWLVAPEGWLVTRVLASKRSRGMELRMMDAGFNVHLAASGMMGSVIRRPWRIHVLGAGSRPRRPVRLTGPLCTSLDMLASEIELPELRVGDLVAVEHSGAYGPTASPTRFIDHPAPSEALLIGDEIVDVTEIPSSGRPR